MKVLLAHPGTQYSHRLAKELSDLHLLSEFHTGFALAGESLVARAVRHAPAIIQDKISNRIAAGLQAEKVVRYPLLELRALQRHRAHRGAQEEIFFQRNKDFQEAIPRGSLAAADAVIGFDTSSWLLAAACRDAGISFILDQSIGHSASKAAVYRSIAETFPHWSGSVRGHPQFLRAAEDAEHALATRISAASTFSIDTLVENGVPREKIWLNPYGVDARKFEVRGSDRGRPLRFLFVGAVTARKGVPLLLEAWSRLCPSQAELWLVGPVSDDDRRLIGEPPGVRVLGAMPHDKIPDAMRACDVFVFPSLFEGFGLVILEAMACGLPVISTAATAGPDVYRDGEGGWIVPTGDAEALARTMDACLARPVHNEEMGRLSRAIAEQHTWERYGERWRMHLATLAA